MSNRDILYHFIGASQGAAIGAALRGEEGQFFRDKLDELAEIVRAMPKTGETDGLGENAIVHLHYFKGGADWFITEKDMGSPDDAPEDRGKQLQAFGWAEIVPGCGEYGYISIEELIENNVELDLYWTPKTVAEAIKGRKA